MQVVPPVVLKHCKLQYKIDLTLKNPSVFQHFNASCAAGGAQTLCQRVKVDVILKNSLYTLHVEGTLAEKHQFYQRKSISLAQIVACSLLATLALACLQITPPSRVSQAKQAKQAKPSQPSKPSQVSQASAASTESQAKPAPSQVSQAQAK